MKLVHRAADEHDDLDPVSLRERLHDTRAEADHLRFSLAEAEALLDAVENELRVVTMRPFSFEEWHVSSGNVIPAIVMARTLTRRVLCSKLRPGGARDRVYADLRLSEVSFNFLLGLRSLRAGEYDP